MHPQSIDLAIVGGGFSGRMLLAQLVRTGALPERTVLFDPGIDQGAGRAWRDPAGLWSANVPAGNLSAWAEDPQHFAQWWATRRQGPVDELAQAFAPRSLYGEYLDEQLAEARAAAAGAGQAVQMQPLAVTQIDQDGHGWRLSCADGSAVHARRVVLATGHGVPQRGLGALAHARDPLAAAVIPELPGNARVLLVGSGLTALDALQKLAVAGHQGPVTVLSRHGLLPSAHAEVPAGRLPWEPAQLAGGVRAALRAVRAELAEVQRNGGDWRRVIDGLRPLTNALWRSWSTADRARFLRHLRAHWDVHRHRVVGDVLGQVHEYLASQDVQRIAGWLDGVELLDDGVLLARWRLRGSHSVVAGAFDVVLDATARKPLAAPLIGQLQRSGLLTADYLQLGLCCDEHGAALDPQGRRQAGLYLLGPLLHARDWESTAVPELRLQAQALARHLAADIDKSTV